MKFRTAYTAIFLAPQGLALLATLILGWWLVAAYVASAVAFWTWLGWMLTKE